MWVKKSDMFHQGASETTAKGAELRGEVQRTGILPICVLPIINGDVAG